MVEKVNVFLLIKKKRDKHLVKVRSFAGAKISFMTNQVNSTL